MAFTLWNLFEAALLCLNAVCVLHEERFLAKMGWGANANVQGFGEQPTVKSQVLNLVRSIRTVMRIPLIFLNIVTIVVKLLLG
ncbi:immediate early response 3-interacting protein 1-like [Homalodisca vitripennis]|uniref:immediate early response 3-interacting protein 1-like n=1 Tax=Homalodisca vitripennis TaxID=197043 RepID=UPI001EECE40C|nr:immediate early response 3-interacting protein 1-like [Homalodisca vitripennis]XP_046687592.1 immediate early response 3-interacting protein 1-like [Homalodisca vitripennis]